MFPRIPQHCTPDAQFRLAKSLQHDPQSTPAEPSYYNIPMLKPPVWEWMIAAYFFFGGLSSGAFAISRMAERFGNGRFKHVATAGAYVALLGLLPCPPLLIADLGDPKRFHHMLRVWKPCSPMNLGTWAITAYGGAAAHQAVRFYLAGPGHDASAAERGKLARLMDNGTLLTISDAAGVPLALLVASYTGVLLEQHEQPAVVQEPVARTRVRVQRPQHRRRSHQPRPRLHHRQRRR